jgi:Pyruvate/2-oxoacid:ferredoxin oxidoreductase delta subunit
MSRRGEGGRGGRGRGGRQRRQRLRGEGGGGVRVSSGSGRWSVPPASLPRSGTRERDPERSERETLEHRALEIKREIEKIERSLQEGAAAGKEPAPAGNGTIAVVDEALCTGCGVCVFQCPEQAILVDETSYKAKINPSRCTGCGVCAEDCPNQAVTMKPA